MNNGQATHVLSPSLRVMSSSMLQTPTPTVEVVSRKEGMCCPPVSNENLTVVSEQPVVCEETIGLCDNSLANVNSTKTHEQPIVHEETLGLGDHGVDSPAISTSGSELPQGDLSVAANSSQEDVAIRVEDVAQLDNNFEDFDDELHAGNQEGCNVGLLVSDGRTSSQVAGSSSAATSKDVDCFARLNINTHPMLTRS
ncbi:hypothetical protein V6N11_045207 [Hibiscus sabdariffa]|uniref:Uncharacterized protein n=1 Tax=Hibiscus sabdariffa TaxID=183260 RepID=A0ABR2NF50_9ROSI